MPDLQLINRSGGGFTFYSKSGSTLVPVLQIDNTGKILGLNSGADQLALNAATSGVLTLKAPNTVSTYTITLPSSQGAANTTLVNNGLGVLSWSTIGGLTIGGSVSGGTSGSILFVNSSGNLAQSNSQLFWDNTNSRLGIKTSSPAASLTISGDLLVNGSSFQTYSGTVPKAEFYHTSLSPTDPDGGTLAIFGTSTAAADLGAAIAMGSAYNGTTVGTGGRIRVAKENATSGNYAFYLALDTRPHLGNLTERLRITSSGNVGIGTSTPSTALQVNGNIRFGAGGAYLTTTASDNFYILTNTNTPNPNFVLGIGNGSGSHDSTKTHLIVEGGTSPGRTTVVNAVFGVGPSHPDITTPPFRVNTSGDIIRLKNVTYSFPSSQGASSTVLTNDGAGNLSWSASLSLGPTGTSSGQTGTIQLRELASNGTNVVALRAADSIATDVIWTLPSADGTNGQALTTNGSGTLSWSTTVNPTQTLTTGGYATSSSAFNAKADLLAPRVAVYGIPDQGWKGEIAASVVSGDSIFIGGSFNAIGSVSDIKSLHGIRISASTAAQDSSYTTLFDGEITCSVVSGNFIYVGGDFTTYNNQPCQRIAKISLVDGSLDATFNSASGFNSTVYSIALDSSGNIYVGGSFQSYKGIARVRIAKLNATTAALDTTFDPLAGFDSTVYSIALDSSGNVYVGGSFTTYQSTTRQRIAKLNGSTAALDSTFNSLSGFDNEVRSLVLDSSGNVYAGGSFTAYQGTTRQRIAKLNGSAILDGTFDSLSGFDSYVYALTLDSLQSNIYVGGEFTTYKGTNTRQRIAKLSASSAALDTTFNSASGFTSAVNCIVLDGAGNLYAGGYFTIYKSSTRQRIVKMSASTAALDTTFDSASGANSKVNTISIYATSGSLFVGGNFNLYKTVNNQVAREFVAKINRTTGAIDTTFNTSTGFNAFVYSLALDSSGNNLYVGGAFTTYKTTNTRQRIAKLNTSTAALDATFDSSTGFDNSVRAMALDNSGNLYAGGDFTTYKSTPRVRLAKIDSSTAALNATFDPGATSFNNLPLTLLSDGSSNLYAGGYFSTYQGTSRSVAKINASTAALDTTFNPSTFGTVNGILPDGSGNLIIYGSFSGGVRKVDTTTGSSVSAFNFGSGANNEITAAVLDGSGQLYIAGLSITSYNGSPRNGLARINATTAALDTTFNPSTGAFNAYPRTIQIDGSANVFIGGSFQSYGSTIGPGQISVSAITAATLSSSNVVGNYTLLSSDNGRAVTINSTTAATITVPSGLPVGFRCKIVQIGTGSVTLVASGTTLNSIGGLQIRGQYGELDLVSYASNVFNITLSPDYVANSWPSLLGSQTASNMSSFMFRNRIINGDMRIDQRNAGATITPSSLQFLTDRFAYRSTQVSKFSAAQTGTSQAALQSGFTKALYLKCISAHTTPFPASDRFTIQQHIEGFNVADLQWGTSAAKSVTLSFWTRSTIVGAHGGAIRNEVTATRSYPFTYTIDVANTWEYKTVVIPGDTTGTWATESGVGISVVWSLGVGSSLSSAANTWAAGDFFSATGATTSVATTLNAELYLTGVQLEAGSVATPFERRPIGVETELCKRYCHVVVAASANFLGMVKGPAATGTSTDCWVYFTTPMRPGTMTYASTATITYTPFSYASASAVAATTSTPTINFFDTNKCLLYITGHGAITSGTGVSMDASGGNIIFSVEL